MKVERAKSEKTEADRSDANARNIRLQTSSNLAASKAAETSNQGAFSKLLDAAKPSENDRSEKKSADSESDSSVDKTSDGRKDEAIEGKTGKRDDQKSSSGDSEGGDGSAWAPAPVPSGESISERNAAPQARSILHVADLERIVSAVRSDSFAGAKEITIDLKNSVLDGLQIKLSLNEQGNLKAEFLALNEQIKKQLDARKSELESVLKDRSIKINELKVTLLSPHEEPATLERNNTA